MNDYTSQVDRIMDSIAGARVSVARRRAWQRSMSVGLLLALAAGGPIAWALRRAGSANSERGTDTMLLASGPGLSDDALLQAVLESNNRSSK
ncbi:MAG TPA: hypothetical protein VGM03_23325 [Phycisphaerae bacterium]|jgi:hypothetical protein